MVLSTITIEKDKDGKIVTDKDGNPKVANSVKMAVQVLQLLQAQEILRNL